MSRPSWEEYALELADAAATRSEDPWVKIGACVLRPDHSVASVGYNGAPSGLDLDWSDREARRRFVIHAEVNALRYCTPAEVAGGLLAVTGTPCPSCLPVIASHGITDVIFGDLLDNYPIETSAEVAESLGITLYHFA